MLSPLLNTLAVVLAGSASIVVGPGALASRLRTRTDGQHAGGHAHPSSAGALSIDGHTLPDGFLYGCGTSAYQIEGAWNEDGKGESIWDHFAHDTGKEHIQGNRTGDVAVDFYHTYAHDVPLFRKALGINNYDFTLSWTRILPSGRGHTPNSNGVQFYHNVARTAHAHDMSASCTLYHWDLPQALQHEYGGWLNRKVVTDFANYARVAMVALGGVCDRWISMNEPRTFCVEGYGVGGESAPGYTFDSPNMTYQCMHHALLAHAAAHETFQDLKKQGRVRGTFGIKIDGGPAKPRRRAYAADVDAAQRSMDFGIGWDLAPLTTGHYPPAMRKTLGAALPHFSPKESRGLKDSYDTIYADLYTSTYAQALRPGIVCDAKTDEWPVCVNETSIDTHGRPIGRPTGTSWNFDVPDTLFEGLRYMHERWGAKQLVVGETGMVLRNHSTLSFDQQINDADRIHWYRSSLHSVKRALKHGIPLVGFIPWSCISNLEWSNGSDDFGLIYTKLGKNQKRAPKRSAHYLRGVLTQGQASA